MSDPQPVPTEAGARNQQAWAPLRHDPFVAFVRSLTRDAGSRARLRRSLSAGAVITDDAWWLLGRWLPTDPDDALVMARAAAWCALHHSTECVRRRTIAGEMRRSGLNADIVRRLLEGATREGTPAHIRTAHITRVLAMCSDAQRIDWAQMISDLIGLNRGGDWAHAVRSRWYREYHNSSEDADASPETETQQPPEGTPQT